MRGHRARRPFLRLCPCAGPAAPRASLEQALEDAVSTSVSKPPKQGPSTGLYSFFVVLVTSGCAGSSLLGGLSLAGGERGSSLVAVRTFSPCGAQAPERRPSGGAAHTGSVAPRFVGSSRPRD